MLNLFVVVSKKVRCSDLFLTPSSLQIRFNSVCSVMNFYCIKQSGKEKVSNVDKVYLSPNIYLELKESISFKTIREY